MPASHHPGTTLVATVRSSLLRLLIATVAFVVTFVAANLLGLGTQLADAATPAHTQARPEPAWVEEAARLNVRYACSHTGLADGVIPERAIVRVGDDVRVVSFEEGWATYHGQRPGILLSVCAR